MYRKIMSFLKEWKESEHRKPLILQGARQVGKTYSILEFGRNHYENVAYFNFETNPRLNKTFAENISPDYLIPILSHIAGQTIVKEQTLIVLDEIQLCERALTSLKYFCEEAPDYHIAALGSLLGVAVSRAKFSFPVGKVDIKTMYPMDMEEFILDMIDFDIDEDYEEDEEEGTITIYGDPKSYAAIQKHLEEGGFEDVGGEFTYIANDLKDVEPEHRETIDKMVERLEEFDDVQTVYTNMKPEESEE